MTVTVEVREQADGNLLSWVDTETVPALGYSLSAVESFLEEPDRDRTDFRTGIKTDVFLDTERDPAAYKILYTVTNANDLEKGSATIQTVFTYGLVDPLKPAATYSTLAEIKARLHIPLTDTDKDATLTQALITAEVAIDQHLGRSFPDPAPLGEVQGIPDAVSNAALEVAVRAYKAADSAGVTAGSTDFFGELEIGGMVTQIVYMNPELSGYMISFGVA